MKTPKPSPTLSYDRAMSVFGCTLDDLKAAVERDRTMFQTGWRMMAMSILSDAQELLERGDRERARQWINRAKWIIGTQGGVK